MGQKVRVRYAPSPTGEPHIGNIRTALFNWLFARHHGGSFILRIEDTDVDRQVAGAVDHILESLRWLGLDWDEGPYFQSQRLELYQRVARELVERGAAYYCYCPPERLEAMREEQRRRGQPPGYDRRCRNLSPQEQERLQREGLPRVIRFKVPLEGETAFHDLIRGPVVFRNQVLDDFIILKSDNYPTYHLASVVDDHLLGITHVIRAEEWLSSTPKHLLLYQAWGRQPPHFAHLPMVLGPDRSKLSKRHGALPLLAYREQGYLPQALVNFLALLGWSLDDRTEVIPREELIRSFSLERIGKAGAIFNQEKLTWMNGVYIRSLSREELARALLPFLERDLPPQVPRPLSLDYVSRITPLIQERIRTLAEAAEATSFFFQEELDYDPSLLLPRGLEGERAAAALEAALKELELLSPFDAGTIEGRLRPLAEKLGLKTGQLFGALRVAVTGRTVAPPLFETMAVLGRERCIERVRKALSKLR